MKFDTHAKLGYNRSWYIKEGIYILRNEKTQPQYREVKLYRVANILNSDVLIRRPYLKFLIDVLN